MEEVPQWWPAEDVIVVLEEDLPNEPDDLAMEPEDLAIEPDDLATEAEDAGPLAEDSTLEEDAGAAPIGPSTS